jgi:hypothetical protein
MTGIEYNRSEALRSMEPIAICGDIQSAMNRLSKVMLNIARIVENSERYGEAFIEEADFKNGVIDLEKGQTCIRKTST